MTKRMVGKQVGSTLYIHQSAFDELPPKYQKLVLQAKTLLPPTFPYEILKIKLPHEVSFVHSPDWDIADEPRVGDSIKVNTQKNTIRLTKGRKTNYQIYHHKWMFVKEDYEGFNVQDSKYRSIEWGILAEYLQIDRKLIGNYDYWNSRVIQELKNHTRGTWKYAFAIPTSNEWSRGIMWHNMLEEQPDLFNGVTSTKDRNYKPHPTQVKNTVKTYERIYHHLLDSFKYQEMPDNFLLLDASSGIGLGTELGRELGFTVEDIEIYPPKDYYPMYRTYEEITKEYDFIICNMVINVIPQDRRDILVRTLGKKLKVGGTLLLTTRSRRDIESQKSGIPFNNGLENCEFFFPSKKSFQKGYTKTELLSYVKDTLNSPVFTFDVEPMTKENSGVANCVGVIIKKQKS